jgi:hypothetical protein
MYEALEVIEESSLVLRELRKIRPKHERLLESMLLEENPITSSHMLSYPFIPNTWTKKIVEYIDLAKELSSERGYIWKSMARKGVEYYEVSISDKKTIDTLDRIDVKEAKETKQRTEEELMQLLLV